MGSSLPARDTKLAKEYFCSGVGKFLDGKYIEAQEEFQEAIRFDPSLPLAYCYLGIISLELGDVEIGQRWCEQGLEIDPNNGYLHYCLGAAFERKGKANDAIAQYKIYLQDHPRDAECLFSLGCAYDQAGNYKEALKFYKKALEFDPSHYKASYNFALVLAEQGKIEKALEYLNKTVDINPTYWKGWIKLGLFYSYEKKWKEATFSYEKAVELRPDISDSYYNLGLCYLSANKSKKAISTLKEGLKRNPQDADSSFYLAIAYIDLRQDEKAIKTLFETLAIDLDHEKTHYLLGRLYYLRGDQQKGDKEKAYLEKLKSPLAETLKSSLTGISLKKPASRKKKNSASSS